MPILFNSRRGKKEETTTEQGKETPNNQGTPENHMTRSTTTHRRTKKTKENRPKCQPHKRFQI